MSLTLFRQSFLLPHSFLLELQAGLKESMASTTQGLQETILTTVNHLITEKLSAQTRETPSSVTVKRPKRKRPSPYKRTTYNNNGEDAGSSCKSRGTTTNRLHVSYTSWSSWLTSTFTGFPSGWITQVLEGARRCCRSRTTQRTCWWCCQVLWRQCRGPETRYTGCYGLDKTSLFEVEQRSHICTCGNLPPAASGRGHSNRDIRWNRDDSGLNCGYVCAKTHQGSFVVQSVTSYGYRSACTSCYRAFTNEPGYHT